MYLNINPIPSSLLCEERKSLSTELIIQEGKIVYADNKTRNKTRN